MLHERPGERWTLDLLARQAHVSRATLARRFAETVGEPPLAYLTRWRMHLAAQRLRHSDDTVDTIARDVGYTSEFAFNRAFAGTAASLRVATAAATTLRKMAGGAAIPCPADSAVVVEPARPEPGYWAGAPSALVVGADTWLAYDGRASKDENFRERTGLATGVATTGLPTARLRADGRRPIADVRYVDAVREPSGALRLYYEAPRSDGAHELRSERKLRRVGDAK